MEDQNCVTELTPPISAFVGDRITLAQLAEAFSFSERAARMLVERLGVSYVKVNGRRYYSPSEIKEALVGSQDDRLPRRVGRPSKGVRRA